MGGPLVTRPAAPDVPAGDRHVRQAALTVASRIAQLALGGVASIVIARALQPDGRGAFAIAVTVATTTLALGHLAIELSHTWLWSEPANRRAVAANSVVLGPAVGTVAALAALLVMTAFGPGAGSGPTVALCALPFATTVVYVNNLLALRARLTVVNGAQLLGAAGQCALLLALAATGHLSVGGAVAVWAVTQALPLAVLLPKAGIRVADFDPGLACRAFGRGIRYHLGSAAVFLLFNVDVFILNALSSRTAVGIYTLAVMVAELGRAVTNSVAQVVLPDQMGSDGIRAAAVTSRATRHLTLVTLLLAGTLCAAAPVLLPVVYGASFAGSVAPLLWLAPGIVALGATRPIAAYLVRLDRPLTNSAVNIGGLVLNVALNLVLIPRFGVVGCALASTVAYAVLAAVQVAWFCRATGIHPRELIPGGQRAGEPT